MNSAMHAWARQCLGLVVVLAVALPAAAQFGGLDVQMNPTELPGSIQNEVSLTLNPTFSPGNVVVAYNDFAAGSALSGDVKSPASW